MGSWMRCLSLEACRVLVLFQLLTSGCIPSLEATVPPSVPRLKSSYNFGKAFLGLDKCNACVGTSICKKFFKEEIRFQNWLSPHLKLPPDYLQSYSGNYTDDAESWRDVEISRLTTKHQHEMSDKKICASLFEGKPCSIEQVLKKTERFQRWMKAKRLTPDLVQGLPSPMLRCPSQRLLDRIVRRYAEVLDAGSVYMNHFRDRDKLRLLFTLSINTHPIVLQIFPGAEGWPFPRYLGSCGRLIVSTSTRPLKAFYSSAPEVAADLAYQLLHIVHSMGSNDLNYFFYFSHIDDDTFGIFSDGRLFIRDSSTLGVIDTQEGYPKENEQLEPKDIFSCLTSNCTSTFAPCDSISEKQNFVVVCNDLLPQLLNGKFPMSVQEKIDRLLNLCKKSSLSDQQVIQAAGKLKEILKSLSTCDSRFAYRYPDCKYSNEY
ncbi:divergent protein kinase domain 2B isoform X1 [Microcaecilia unicolor]|uniref:Divergent protein kinase domain 2B isoform X1 n=1 Tax=Microcaecilia unicolor TaxID=1415580 RepID=A0A6P7XYK3_9AMPH|nr:divergent protein kinase domain 2B isoform X1 [Microcaecilia unicolor]